MQKNSVMCKRTEEEQPAQPEMRGGRRYGGGFPGGSVVKNPSAKQETRVRSLDQEDPLKKEMAIHSSILAWRIPLIEEPGRLQSVGLQRVGHD